MTITIFPLGITDLHQQPSSMDSTQHHHKVNLSESRSFSSILNSDLKETFFPDDPFRRFKNKPSQLGRIMFMIEYFLPMFRWLPNYSLGKFQGDIVAGITIAIVTIPQSISHARLTNLPPIVGLYSCFVPPLIYSIFGSSKNVAIGTVASASILSAAIIGEKVSPVDSPELYVSLVFTSAFFAGIFQTALGIFRLGILVDFLSRSTILGFTGGTATIIILQQLKGILGLKRFTTKTDVVSVLHSLYDQRQEWSWQTAVLGIIFICFLLLTKFIKNKRPKLFWVSAIGPAVVMIFGGLFACLIDADDNGIPTVGPLKKGLNPLSIGHLTFHYQYLPIAIKAGIVTGSLALVEGVAVGRSLALMNNDHVDGNKEMIAFGMMNIAGSFTSCYLTTAPFSKSAVNYDYGCKTAMSNVVMSTCIMFVLLFLGPLFRHTPLVSLAAMIIIATAGLIKCSEFVEMFKVDKFDFFISVVAFLSVVFVSMEIGLMISVSISVVRTLLQMARPTTYKLGKSDGTQSMYLDINQYQPSYSTMERGILVLRVCSPIFFANAPYLRERIRRWVEEELDVAKNNGCHDLYYLILDIGGVTSIDMTGIEMLHDVCKFLEKRLIKLILTDPRAEVVGKLVRSKVVDMIGKEWVFLSINEAVNACHQTLQLHQQTIV